MGMELYLSQYLGVAPDVLAEYGVFDVSVASDLPLFIDPFLIFHSDKPEYQALHQGILKYLRFLRHKAVGGQLDRHTSSPAGMSSRRSNRTGSDLPSWATVAVD